MLRLFVIIHIRWIDILINGSKLIEKTKYFLDKFWEEI